ncbi:TonB-dependent receptor domain-containing protein [Simiduia aestuariiviva]|uniref:Iron complex outermembrane receptor protein n=1 Tax=Simiduia aestuariiviva TaxID=1510459 RepID=A0A839UHZ9_9GAMM|nr:iron complex outermembrane receptor protein [Simiduia aestuariiviva]
MAGFRTKRYLKCRPSQFLALVLALLAPQSLLAAPQAFSIPAQPLADSLLAFAEQSETLRLVFRPAELEGLQAPALEAELEPEQGLARLLSGLPLTVQQLEPGIFLIAPQASETAVTGRVRPAADQQRDPSRPGASLPVPVMEELVTIGTRAKNRRLQQSTVPIDIVQGYLLERAAPASLGEQLQSQAPSFNYSRTMVSDGADLVRPATLRGMNPDQLLVMVDGKRRHHQAQINIQQVVGRGSSGTDMNAIPTAALERIEVLRDGASAQYGSDAIAGVLNLVLKEGEQAPELDAQYGHTAQGDGETLIASLSGGLALGEEGSVFLTLEGQDRGATNRAGVDSRFAPPRVSMRIGDTAQSSYSLFANSQWRGSDRYELYAFGGVSRREGLSAGFYRGAGAVAGEPPVSSRYLPALDPLGFLPLQTTRTEDDALTLGAQWQLTEQWNLDLFTSYGANRFMQGTDYSVNVSLGSDSPTQADNGELRYSHWQHGAVASGLVEASGIDELLVTLGVEMRREHYRISEGDFASYAYGPTDNFDLFIPSPLDPCPNEQGALLCSDGQPRSRAQAGMQAYPGYRLAAADTRQSGAWFVESEAQVNAAWTLSLASRWEHYERMGSNLSGKVSMRWSMTPQLSARGTLATGFRAPGINQANFTHIITNIGPDVLTNTLHAAEGNPVLSALNVPALSAERSRQTSVGLVWQPMPALSVTLDAFMIDVADAIALSDVIAAEDEPCPSACALTEALAQQAHNVGAVQFLYNAMDTRTTGLDLVARYRWSHRFGSTGVALLAHLNSTEVVALAEPADIPPGLLFSDAQIMLVEQGQPRRRLLINVDWQYLGWTVGVRANHFGSVSTSYFTESGLGVDLPNVQDSVHHSGNAWLLDGDISYSFNSGITLAAGGNNLLDTYPKRLSEDSLLAAISGGSFKYPWEASPYGINGAFYYIRAEWSF